MSELYFCSKSGWPQLKRCQGCRCEEVVEARPKVYRKKQKQIMQMMQAHIDAGRGEDDWTRKMQDVYKELQQRISDETDG